jgi:SNF family Na+-dependent transporter
MGLLVTALGGLAAWRTDILGAMDTLANNVFLIGGGLALAIFAGYVMDEPADEALAGSSASRWTAAWLPLLRYVVPVVLSIILVVSISGTIDTIVALF